MIYLSKILMTLNLTIVLLMIYSSNKIIENLVNMLCNYKNQVSIIEYL